MIIDISARHLTISPASRRVIATYNSLLTRYFKRIHSIRWVFEAVRTGVRARLRVHASSGDYRFNAIGKTIRELVGAACDSVETQRRRRKRIRERSRRTQNKGLLEFARTPFFADRNRWRNDVVN